METRQRTVTRQTIQRRVTKMLKQAGITLTAEEKKRVVDFHHWDSSRIRCGGGLIATNDKNVNEGRKIWKEKCETQYGDYLVEQYS